MKIRSRVLAVVLCLVTVFLLVSTAFAASAALTAAEIFSSMWSVYASSMGLTSSFKTSGQLNSISNPYSSTAFTSKMSSLFSAYQTSISGSMTLTDWAAWALNKMSVTAGPSTKTIFRMTSDLVQFFDAFGTYVLEDVVGVDKNADGFFPAVSPWYDNIIYSNPGTQIAVVPFANSYSDFSSNWLKLESNSNYRIAANVADAYAFFCTSNNRLYVCSPNSGAVLYASSPSGGGTYGISTYVSSYGIYYNYNIGVNASTVLLPKYASPDAGFEAIVNPEAASSLQVAPRPGYADDVIGIPDVDSEDYAPDVIVGTLGYPWEEGLTASDALSDVLSWVKSKVLANLEVADNSVAADPGAAIAIGNDPTAYSAPVGLKDVFPFCLPFDLYNLFACLAADPVAPSFEVPINFAPLNLTYTFEIDLSAFSDVAALLRKLELLGFCVALVLITRQKMIRG